MPSLHTANRRARRRTTMRSRTTVRIKATARQLEALRRFWAIKLQAMILEKFIVASGYSMDTKIVDIIGPGRPYIDPLRPAEGEA